MAIRDISGAPVVGGLPATQGESQSLHAMPLTRRVPTRAERWALLLEFALRDGDAPLLLILLKEIRAEGLVSHGNATVDVRTQATVALAALRQRAQGRAPRAAR